MPQGSNKNKSKVTSADKSKVLKFTQGSQTKVKLFGKRKKGESIFVFDNVKAKKVLENSDKFSNVPNKRRKRRPRRRKVDQFSLSDQELEIEQNKRKQQQHANWNKRQQSMIGRVTKVRTLNTRLVKMMSRPQRKRKGTNRSVCTTAKVRKQINKEEQVTIKAMKRPIRTTHLLEKEEPRMFCSEKRQQSM